MSQEAHGLQIRKLSCGSCRFDYFTSTVRTDGFSAFVSAYNNEPEGSRAMLLYRLKALGRQVLLTLSGHRCGGLPSFLDYARRSVGPQLGCVRP